MAIADELIRAALRGERPSWPWPEQDADAAFMESVALHGVHALLNDGSPPWPQRILEALRAHTIAQAMWELRHQEVLSQTLAELSRAGIVPMLIKGTALAYSLYADPVLRTRGDTDLVIAIAHKETASDVLHALGYAEQATAGGELASYQASFTLQVADGSSHTLDLHWKINNSEVLSRLFTYEDLRKHAVPLVALSPHAFGASAVHALLIASMHRATHRHNPYYVDGVANHDPDRLVWLYDIHLLAQHFTQLQWSDFAQLAAAKGLRAVCLDGLERACACLGTSYPHSVQQALGAPGEELPAAYLAAGPLRQHWMDLRALGAWQLQRRKVRELFFPPADYMRQKYAGERMHWLPWLYLRRATGGVLKRVGARRLFP